MIMLNSLHNSFLLNDCLCDTLQIWDLKRESMKSSKIKQIRSAQFSMNVLRDIIQTLYKCLGRLISFDYSPWSRHKFKMTSWLCRTQTHHNIKSKPTVYVPPPSLVQHFNRESNCWNPSDCFMCVCIWCAYNALGWCFMLLCPHISLTLMLDPRDYAPLINLCSFSTSSAGWHDPYTLLLLEIPVIIN